MNFLARNFWYLFLIPGLLMLATGLTLGLRAAAFQLASTCTQGTVINNHYRSTGEHNGSYYPEVRFSTPDGRTRQFTGRVGESPAAFDEGTQVPVLYNAGLPEEAVIATFSQQYLTPLVAMAFGLVLTLSGGMPLLSRWRRERLCEWLKRHGSAVEANVTGSPRESGSAHSTRNPYHVTASWMDPSTLRTHTFQSVDVCMTRLHI